ARCGATARISLSRVWRRRCRVREDWEPVPRMCERTSPRGLLTVTWIQRQLSLLAQQGVRMSRVRALALTLFAVAGFAQQALDATTATTPKAGEMNAHFINVGQGASVLLEFSCGAALLDTGGEVNGDFNSTTALTTYLDAFFARRTDLKKTLGLVVI